MKRVLVVEADRTIRESLRLILEGRLSVDAVSPGDDPAAALRRQPYHLLIFGLSEEVERDLGDLRSLLLIQETLPLILLISKSFLPRLEPSVRGRVSSILPKPFDVLPLLKAVEKALARAALSTQAAAGAPTPDIESALERDRLLRRREGWEETKRLTGPAKERLRRAIASDTPVLLEGEPGSGKTLSAEIIHSMGRRRRGPLVRVECRNLSPERLEALIRNAASRHPDTRDRMTLFLIEVADLPFPTQLRLLEMLEGSHRPRIDAGPTRLDLRVIAASSEKLEDCVADRRFRLDLYDRLSVLPIPLAPLRNRLDEMEEIVDAIVRDLSREMSLPVRSFSREAIETLRQYHWPGNIRELETVVARSLALSGEGAIGRTEVQFSFGTPSGKAPERAEPRGLGEAEEGVAPPRPASEQTATEEWPGRMEPPPAAARSASPIDFGRLAVQLAHEVKNPLVAIKTFTHLLEQKFNDDEFRGNFYRIVTEDIDRIDGLIDSILNYAKLTKPQNIPVPLDYFIDKVLKEQENKLGRRRIIILRDTEESVPDVLCDRDFFHYAFGCVLDKIIDVMPEGADIHVKTVMVEPAARPTAGVVLAFGNPEHLLYPINVVSDRDAEETLRPGSVEIWLAERIMERQGGLLRVESRGGETTEVTLGLPTVPESLPHTE